MPRDFDMPTVDPDKEDEIMIREYFVKGKGVKITLPDGYVVDRVKEDETKEKGQFEKQTARMIGEYLDESFAHLEKLIPSKGTVVYAGTPKENVCNHEWKSYLGLNERFEYCIHCEEKRK